MMHVATVLGKSVSLGTPILNSVSLLCGFLKDSLSSGVTNFVMLKANRRGK